MNTNLGKIFLFIYFEATEGGQGSGTGNKTKIINTTINHASGTDVKVENQHFSLGNYYTIINHSVIIS